ncbi:MAG: insulinase family protein, partial [Actinomycetota bacterium]
IALISVSLSIFAQEKPPAPSAPRDVKIPLVQEKKLPNGLTVVVVERNNLPLVTAQLMVKNGAGVEDGNLAGLADTTVTMLTKGTKTRTATKIAKNSNF